MARIKKQILPEEIELVEKYTSNLDNIKHYKVKSKKSKKDIISFYCADYSTASICNSMKNYITSEQLLTLKNNEKLLDYQEILQFKLVEATRRTFVFRLNFSVKDEDYFWTTEWADVGKFDKLSCLMGFSRSSA
jgi:hypothetical protein